LGKKGGEGGRKRTKLKKKERGRSRHERGCSEKKGGKGVGSERSKNWWVLPANDESKNGEEDKIHEGPRKETKGV